MPLPGVARLAEHLDEAVVEREVVADAVLPLARAVAVEGEALGDEAVDGGQREAAAGGVRQRHGDERDVRVGRLPALRGRRRRRPGPGTGRLRLPAARRCLLRAPARARLRRAATAAAPTARPRGGAGEARSCGQLHVAAPSHGNAAGCPRSENRAAGLPYMDSPSSVPPARGEGSDLLRWPAPPL